jgi:hypothetical protein
MSDILNRAAATEIDRTEIEHTVILRYRIELICKTGWERVVCRAKHEEASGMAPRLAQEFGRKGGERSPGAGVQTAGSEAGAGAGSAKSSGRERCCLRMGDDPGATSVPDPGAFSTIDPSPRRSVNPGRNLIEQKTSIHSRLLLPATIPAPDGLCSGPMNAAGEEMAIPNVHLAFSRHALLLQTLRFPVEPYQLHS